MLIEQVLLVTGHVLAVVLVVVCSEEGCWVSQSDLLFFSSFFLHAVFTSGNGLKRLTGRLLVPELGRRGHASPQHRGRGGAGAQGAGEDP